jgi:hypothetical protein
MRARFADRNDRLIERVEGARAPSLRHGFLREAMLVAAAILAYFLVRNQTVGGRPRRSPTHDTSSIWNAGST